MDSNISNPRMINPDGVYASEARADDFFSLRDHFAGLAMQGILSNPSVFGTKTMFNDDISKLSYSISDALLLERSVSQNGS